MEDGDGVYEEARVAIDGSTRLAPMENGKKWEKTMTDNNKTGTNCRRYNTHQIGTMDTNENRFAGPIKLNLGKEINV